MKEAPKVSPETLRIIGAGGQILLPFNMGDATVSFSRWTLAEMIEEALQRKGPKD